MSKSNALVNLDSAVDSVWTLLREEDALNERMDAVSHRGPEEDEFSFGLSDIDKCYHCGEEIYEWEYSTGYRYWTHGSSPDGRRNCAH